jgi:Fic-DOC domain mobile mystery protein B
MFEDEPDGATPLDPDEAEGLLPAHIHTRSELNLWEQANIVEGARWSMRARSPALLETTLRELHRRMFNETWAWAGRYRRSDKNVGVHWPTIAVGIRDLVNDGQFWLAHQTFSIDETAARLHHRIVAIHPFPNGNGRHGRLWCDMILRQNGRPPFEWRNQELDVDGAAREAYISALRAADCQDYAPLFGLLLRGRP